MYQKTIRIQGLFAQYSNMSREPSELNQSVTREKVQVIANDQSVIRDAPSSKGDLSVINTPMHLLMQAGARAQEEGRVELGDRSSTL